MTGIARENLEVAKRNVSAVLGVIGPGKEFVDAPVGVAADDLADHISEIGEWVDAVEFAGFN
jgi:hypothetical protein